MPGTPNHAPTPAVEAPTDPALAQETCEQIKARYGIETGTHKANECRKSVSYQSHHILQGAATNNLINYDSAMCVLLANSHSGTAHQITTARQNQRRDNKKHGRGGTQPATNFGDLKKLARDDLVESLTKGKGIPQEDAEKLADCLVAEAEKKIKKDAKTEKNIDVTDSTPVLPIGGCFAPGTLLWMHAGHCLRADQVACGDMLFAQGRALAVARVDHCVQDLVCLQVAGGMVSLAPFHRVLTVEAGPRRADQLRVGELLQTDQGAARLEGVQHDPRPQRVIGIGMAQPFQCRIGSMGLWVDLPDTGAAVSRVVQLAAYAPPPSVPSACPAPLLS